MHALQGKTVSQVKGQLKKKKKPNNKQYETVPFQKENVLSHSEEGKEFYTLKILRKRERISVQ